MPVHSRSVQRLGLVMALVGALGLFGLMVLTAKPRSTVATVSLAAAQCRPSPLPTDPAGSPGVTAGSERRDRGCPEPTGTGTSTGTPTDTGTPTPTDTSTPPVILGDDCSTSTLEAHTGFQDGNRCVSTAFGEVAEESKNPSLLIRSAPGVVGVGKPFTITVSTRNLVRDRFLPAKAGGYYLESSFLNENGLTRGHFHTACRMLTSRRNAPDPAPVPAFFVATEDGGGGAKPDTVTVTVTTGLPERGTAQCAVWAGDGSHRVPMMQRANQIPAFDVVRIAVR